MGLLSNNFVICFDYKFTENLLDKVYFNNLLDSRWIISLNELMFASTHSHLETTSYL